MKLKLAHEQLSMRSQQQQPLPLPTGTLPTSTLPLPTYPQQSQRSFPPVAPITSTSSTVAAATRSNNAPSTAHASIWMGSISWTTGEQATKRDMTIWCSAAPIQAATVVELCVFILLLLFSLPIFWRHELKRLFSIAMYRSTLVLPPSLRITNLVPVKMEVLQDLATKYKLPAITLSALPTSSLSEGAKNDLATIGSNEELYTMFAKNLDGRKVVRLGYFL